MFCLLGSILSTNTRKLNENFIFRDPNTLKTIDTFNSSVKWACNGSFTESDIEEAKLSVFSAVRKFLYILKSCQQMFFPDKSSYLKTYPGI